MKNRIIVLLGFLVLVPLGVLAESTARSYQECLLEITRDGYLTSKQDIGRVKQLCEKRFPDSVPNMLGDRLDNDALSKIDIYTNRTDNGVINGSVYNGNPHLTLTRLEVLITPKTQKGSVMDFFDSEEFRLHLKIKPYATEPFSIEPEKTEIKGQFSWKLIRAWGY
jgi:hypothetical protein